MSGLPRMRWLVVPSWLSAPAQNARTSSRNFPFHSDHSAGNPPTWYPAVSHGSAISFTGASTGSCSVRSRNALRSPTSAALAGQGGGEVEAEAVDVHLAAPSTGASP